MPGIPRWMLDCVVYLYPTAEMARSGENFGACGFITTVKSTTRPGACFQYVVSNYHAAIGNGQGAPVVRVNRKNGGVHVLELDVSDWHFLPNGGDVAVAQFGVSPEVAQFSRIPLDSFLREGEEHLFDVGDDVFMVGRFIDHDGGPTNLPAARFGNVSIAPSTLPDCSNSDQTTKYFCLDMHSRTGSSGGPVFVYRTLASDLALSQAEIHMNSQRPQWLLLGIHCGQFPENMWLEGQDKQDERIRPIKGYSGMTYSLPAWKIRDALMHPRLVARRDIADGQWK